MFYATGRTKLYRNIGLIMMPLGLGVTFLVLAPRSIGWDLKATGLALKTVTLTIVQVNLQLYHNARGC